MRGKWRGLLTVTVCLSLVLTWGIGMQAAFKEEKTARELDELLGSVKSIVIENAAVGNDGGIPREGPRTLVEWREYDYKGNRVRTITYDKSGLVEKQQHWIRDGAGRCIETTVHKGDGTLESRSVYAYDSLGRQVEEARYRGDGSLDARWLYVYAENGNIVDASLVRGDGSLSMKLLTKYNEKEEQVETESYLYLGPLTVYYKYVNRYDANGHRIEQVSYGADGSQKGKMTWAYDGRGNLFEHASYKQGGILEYKFVYSYDAYGRKVATVSYKQGPLPGIEKLWGKTLYQYDGEGRLTRESHYDADDKIEKVYGYEYDRVGNWVKKTECKAIAGAGEPRVEPVQVTYRAITYYEP